MSAGLGDGCYDVIIDDVHAATVAEQGNQLASELGSIFNRYRRIMEQVAEKAVTGGATHSAFVTFAESLNALAGAIEETGSCYRTAVNNGLDNIGDADKYLY